LGVLVLKMCVELLIFYLFDSVDSEGVFFVPIADETIDGDGFVIARDVDIIIFYFLDLVE
jgi:hypothetical protein